MTALDDVADIERPAMRDAARRLGLNASDAGLVSASSRLIWHLPVDQVALTITRSGSKTADDIRAEVAAVRSATAGGVRTPPLLSAPAELVDSRFALPYRWVDGRAFKSTDWPAGVAEAAKLAGCAPKGLRRMSWPTDWPDPAWELLLGQRLFAELGGHARHADRLVQDLLKADDLVPCHGDLQPANVLVDEAGDPWLIDLEYACLAPASWDAAKIVILADRFGNPSSHDNLLRAWGEPSERDLPYCVFAQEVQLVCWLLRMADSEDSHSTVAVESRARAKTLMSRHGRWRHLSS